jgi:hypothetical protein
MSSDKNIPFQTIDWTLIPKTEYKGESGTALWQTVQLYGLRIRIVEYSKGYIADHWCQKGHIVLVLKKGMSYVVSDGLSSHRSISKNGVKVMIIDGDFLGCKS